MESEQYRIILSGKALDGWDLNNAKTALSKLFKGDANKAEKLLSGRPTRLNKVLNAQAAKQYKLRFEQAGVLCGVEKIKANTPSPQNLSDISLIQPAPQQQATADNPLGLSLEPIATQQSEATQAASSLPDGCMQCPKCNEVQPQADECQSCGIIISKFTASTYMTQPATNDHSDDEDATIEQQLTWFVRDNTTYYAPKFSDFSLSGGSLASSWNWAAFFLPIPWFFHRKMYLQTAVVALLPTLVLLFSWGLSFFIQLIISITSGLLGNSIYYLHAKSVINKLETEGDADRGTLEDRGGTHSMGITILATILIGIALSFINTTVMFNSDEFAEYAEITKSLQNGDIDMNKPGMEKLVMLDTTLKLIQLGGSPYPKDRNELIRKLKISKDKLVDKWGNPIQYQLEGKHYTLRSAGPDKKLNTSDDLVIGP